MNKKNNNKLSRFRNLYLWALIVLKCHESNQKQQPLTFHDLGDAIGISQSGISYHVAALEKAFNQRVIERSERGVHGLTRFGLEILPQLESIVAIPEKIQQTEWETMGTGHE